MAYYCLKYATKTQKEVEDLLNWYIHKFQNACNYYPLSSESDNLSNSKKRILSMTYAMTSKQEVAEPLACLYIIRQSPFYFSHEFTTINVVAVIKQIQNTSWMIPLVQKSDENYVYNNQLDIYLNRSSQCEDMCWYEFVSNYNKTIQSIPVLLGKKPSPDMDDEYSKMFVDVLFKPFRNIQEIIISQNWLIPPKSKTYVSYITDYINAKNSNEVDVELQHYLNLSRENVPEEDSFSCFSDSDDSSDFEYHEHQPLFIDVNVTNSSSVLSHITSCASIQNHYNFSDYSDIESTTRVNTTATIPSFQNNDFLLRKVTFAVSVLDYNHPLIDELPESYTSILSISRKFRLNLKQHQSFIRGCLLLLRSWCIEFNISKNDLPASFNTLPSQDIFHIVGPAGYGKSKIIEGLLFFALSWERQDSIIVTSFTASAAQNAGGVNIHALFGWSPNQESKPPNDFIKNKFRRCKLLIFDEISAIQQSLMGNVSLCLQSFMDQILPLGGINCLLIGDWLQLPPTASNPLYNEVNPFNASNKTYIASCSGKMVWDKITHVVYLKENMRHSSNPVWIKILNNWRRGVYDQDDVNYVNEICTIDNTLPLSIEYCPYITASNITRVQINRSATYQFALKNNLCMYQVPAFSSNQPVPITFWTLRDDTTQRVPMLLELVIGMPLSCSTNIPNLIISNGSLTHLLDIRWPKNTTFHTLTSQDGLTIKRPSCLPEFIFVKRMYSNITLPNLPPSVVALSPKKKSVKFNLENRSFSKTIFQMPVVAAFSITTDKSQGLTFEANIIGPQSDLVRKRPPPQINYVAFSRCSTIHNIRLSCPITLEILLKFKPSKKLLEIDDYLLLRDARNNG
jgi:hypothetical protein